MQSNSDIKIAPCGLICNDCPLFLVPYDEKAAKEVLNWFKKECWYKENQKIEDIIINEDYCEGCRSSRKSLHWSPECEILKCCINKRDLNFCYECSEFPCKTYNEWIARGKKYRDAFENLKHLKQEKT